MTATVQHPSPDPAPEPELRAAPGPAHLRLIGTSEDGAWLRLLDDEGAEHLLANDDRLRAVAQRGNPASSGGRPREKTMESTLRPRDIQARIRAGETPEAVAEAAQTSVEKIMPFAAPVLAEREHVAQRAQRSSVRRGDAGAPGGARTLGEAVEAHLRGRNVAPDAVAWDAWRREDGRWTLTAEFATAARSGTAELTFDAPGNYVTLDNEDARWLVGEALPAPAPAADDLRAARERRRTAAPADQELPLGDDPADKLGDDAIGLVAEQPVEAFLDPERPTEAAVVEQERELVEEAADAAAAQEPEPAAEPEPPARRPVKKTRGRASVPSWDEIMFGGPGGSDRV